MVDECDALLDFAQEPHTASRPLAVTGLYRYIPVTPSSGPNKLAALG